MIEKLEKILPITSSMTSEPPPLAKAEKRSWKNRPYVSCGNLYFLFIGMLIGTMVGFMLNHERHRMNFFNGNTCIVPCDKFFKENSLRWEADTQDKDASNLPNILAIDAKLARKEMTNGETSKIEVTSDLARMPLPTGPFGEIESQDSSPSGIGLKFTRLGGISVRRYTVGIPDPMGSDATDQMGPMSFDSEMPITIFGSPSVTDLESDPTETVAEDSSEAGFFAPWENFPPVEKVPSMGDMVYSFGTPGLPGALSRLFQAAAAFRPDDIDQTEEVPMGPDEDVTEINYGMENPDEPQEAKSPAAPLQNNPIGYTENNPITSQSEKEAPKAASASPDTTYSFYFSKPEEKVSWYYASKECQLRDMELVSIENAEKSSVLDVALALVDGEADEMFWTSGSDVGAASKTASALFWGSTGNKLSYTNWNSAQPVLSNLSDNCIGLQHDWQLGKQHYKWTTDTACSSSARFICQSSHKKPSEPKAETPLGDKVSETEAVAK